MSYHHLSRSERGKIALFYRNRVPVREIARRLGRSSSTISRELRRNSREEHYQSDYAQASYVERRAHCRRKCLYEDEHIQNYVTEKLMQTWSPEQIAGRLSTEIDQLGFTVSMSSIYRWLKCGSLPRSIQLQKKLRHYGHSHGEKRGVKANARELRSRCRAALRRQRYGDWEADTIVFGSQPNQTHLLSLADRKSRFCCLLLLRNTKKEEMLRAFEVFFGDGKLPLETMTSDRGIEFNCHQEFEATYHKYFYYTRPASPWQKPTVENLNGLVRQFFPRGIPVAQLTPEEIRNTMDMLNNRPRKCLNWLTPSEVLHFT